MPATEWAVYSAVAYETKNEPERRWAPLQGRDAQVKREPPIGIEPMTYSLRVRLEASSIVRTSLLTWSSMAQPSTAIQGGPGPLLADALAISMLAAVPGRRMWRSYCPTREREPDRSTAPEVHRPTRAAQPRTDQHPTRQGPRESPDPARPSHDGEPRPFTPGRSSPPHPQRPQYGGYPRASGPGAQGRPRPEHRKPRGSDRPQPRTHLDHSGRS